MTDDDCTVDPSWVAAGADAVRREDGAIVTGRVLAVEGTGTVPSTRDNEEREDFTGTLRCDGVYTGNVAAPRHALLEFGPFDERLATAEDNDLCYRWLRSGRRLVFDPRLVVWHHDWRTPEELRRLYREYWRGQGAFYAKHLRRRDRAIVRFIAYDLQQGTEIVRRRLLDGRTIEPPERGALRGLATGMLTSWRAFPPRDASEDGVPRRA
jgi:GT2 family glycosyltransferase